VLVALVSAKGSPGVTTAAVALAAVWPQQAVLADLDSAGGDLAIRYHGPHGEPLQPETGVISLGAALRRSATTPLTDHVQLLAGGIPVLAGVSGPQQLAGIGPVWQHLARSLRDAPTDVLADCGRLAGASPVESVVTAADLIVVVARTSVADLAHLRTRLAWLASRPASGAVVVVLVSAERRRSQVVADVRRLLAGTSPTTAVLGTLALDPRGAQALVDADALRASRSSLVRSARALTRPLRTAAAAGAAPALEAALEERIPSGGSPFPRPPGRVT
jgi:MinD-like ATPase involved in chromosome partitioning or flagellar assembly